MKPYAANLFAHAVAAAYAVCGVTDPPVTPVCECCQAEALELTPDGYCPSCADQTFVCDDCSTRTRLGLECHRLEGVELHLGPAICPTCAALDDHDYTYLED